MAVEEARKQPAIVDVTMKMQEGEQYFVNRITFQGNTTTRDNVIRREIRLLENGVFNTEALKFSVKRINQLGYFKQIEEGSDVVKVEKTPGEKNKVDVTLKFEEQNRNQLTFGAGVSQYEGFFGQLAFQTSNFMGRGESATFSVLAGARVRNYQLAFTEPFLFDRPITAGFDVFSREIRYYYSYTQASTGFNIVTGFPVGNFSRMFFNYRLEQSRVKDINEAFLDPEVIGRNPFLADALLISEGGKRLISQVTPSFVHNTIDNPIFPNAGQAVHVGHRPGGPRRQHQLHQAARRGGVLAAHHQEDDAGHAGPVRVHPALREHDRVADLRAAVPGRRVQHPGLRHPHHRAARHRHAGTPGSFIVLGGNKSALFNAEYQFALMSQVRIMAFFDAGQVKDLGVRMNWDDFVMSTGAEVRFFMPVLNVPFRLIYARNINYEAFSTTTWSPPSRTSSDLRWAPRSRPFRIAGLVAIIRGSYHLRKGFSA